MINLSQRSFQRELMDGHDIPFAAMAQTLKELDFINTWLGGHAITMKGVKSLLTDRQSIIICEIGCGGGDNLFAIHKWCKRRDIPATFIGIDRNNECIEFARQQYPQLDCEWIFSDYETANFSSREPDIIFSSLFCHHFTDEQLVFMLRWLKQHSVRGFFINDLQRHWLAYYLIKYLTRWFSRSYLVKNDACLSVARSFRKKDWQQLFDKAGLTYHRISWQWAFRWLVISK